MVDNEIKQRIYRSNCIFISFYELSYTFDYNYNISHDRVKSNPSFHFGNAACAESNFKA